MRIVFLSLVFLIALPPAAADDGLRFSTIDVYLTSDEPVAAWQFELADTHGTMKVVGVENGDSKAFSDAPYYDRQAVNLGTADRIIVADFSLADESELPSGEIRLTTLHLMLEGDDEPAFDLHLVTATTQGGQAIDASISLKTPTGSDQ